MVWCWCRRGKKGQKHYTVFVCDVDAAARTAFVPALNDEHREAQWWPLAALPPVQKLHPVVVREPMPPTLLSVAQCLGFIQSCSYYCRQVVWSPLRHFKRVRQVGGMSTVSYHGRNKMSIKEATIVHTSRC